jgi:hypothetical protein
MFGLDNEVAQVADAARLHIGEIMLQSDSPVVISICSMFAPTLTASFGVAPLFFRSLPIAVFAHDFSLCELYE